MKFVKIIITLTLLWSVNAFSQEKQTNPCQADKKKLCSQCTAGDKTCVQKCMHDNSANLSAECKAQRETQKASKKTK